MNLEPAPKSAGVMRLRKGMEHDIPAIVDLLKMSLGEELTPKSEPYWRWKHIDNPFGSSPVILAFDDDKLVGVRAFMHWRWKVGEEALKAVRAVDTATHPDYQGRGIFRRLTMAMLEHCKEQGWHFVFNTPNRNSKPGYLKMGWSEAGKLPVRVRVVRPLRLALHALRVKQNSVMQVEDDSVARYLAHPGLDELMRKHQKLYSGVLITPHTPASLQWRYFDVPVAKYYACGIETGSALRAVLFYRVKGSRSGVEFRITDIFSDSPSHEEELRRLIVQQCKRHGADYITMAGMTSLIELRGQFTSARLSIGPIVTIKNICMDADRRLRNFNDWSPSLGDLELF